MALFSISDTGPGISPDITDRLFQPFVTTKANGMGVGLSICRTIIESHGGRIWADTNAAGGTDFQFTLPVAELEVGHAR
jgi:two-component system sensor kinase FixL